MNKEMVYRFAQALISSPLIYDTIKKVAVKHQIPETLAGPIADIIIDKLKGAFHV